MEEEDVLLGLMPSQALLSQAGEDDDALSRQQATNVGRSWAFEQALRVAAAQTKDVAERSDESDAEADEVESGASDSEDDRQSEGGEVAFHGDDAEQTGGASSRALEGSSGVNTNGAELSDAQLLEIQHKKEAKRLGKHLYRRWKKLQRSGKKKSKKSSSKKSKKHHDDDGRKKKKKESKRREKRRNGDDELEPTDIALPEEDGVFLTEVDANAGLGGEPLSAEASAIEARLQKAAIREAKLRQVQSAKKVMQRKTNAAELVEIATKLVADMGKARRLDEDIIHGRAPSNKVNVFPLHRVALRALVQARCRQSFLVGPLVEAGILQELSYWIYDFELGEPGSYELRTAALDCLLLFPMEGSVKETEDLTTFMGVGREHLMKTDLGRAVNALRKYKGETTDNRAKCLQLLTMFSRAISGTGETKEERLRNGDESHNTAVWRCQNDPTVASPFEVVETCSEAFQKSFLKPDPRDPTSYNNLLAWRPPAATITNVSGTLASFIDQAADGHVS